MSETTLLSRRCVARMATQTQGVARKSLDPVCSIAGTRWHTSYTHDSNDPRLTFICCTRYVMRASISSTRWNNDEQNVKERRVCGRAAVRIHSVDLIPAVRRWKSIASPCAPGVYPAPFLPSFSFSFLVNHVLSSANFLPHFPFLFSNASFDLFRVLWHFWRRDASRRSRERR